MARNKVQFQKGLSEAQFAILYGTEAQCREAVMRWRWPSGFLCPVCGGKQHSLVKTRALYQCTACRRQTSVIAGTIFAATKVPLCTWFRAMYHLTQSKGGISSIELGRRLGVTQLGAAGARSFRIDVLAASSSRSSDTPTSTEAILSIIRGQILVGAHSRVNAGENV